MNKLRFAELYAPRWNAKARGSFARRLSFLLRSGMPLPAALSSLAESTDGNVRRALYGVREDVEQGRTFAESAAEHPRLFPPFFTQVIAVGESSGTLSDNLAHMAAELEKSAQLRSRLIGSLAYPAAITLAAFLLTASLVLFVFPKIVPVFSGLDVPLPVSTRILLAISDYLRVHGISTLIAAIAAALLLSAVHKRSLAFRKRCELVLFAFPFAGPMLLAYHVSGSSRTLALLIESGMPIGSALRAAARASGSIAHGECFLSLADATEEGRPLAAHLRQHLRLFPRLVADMAAAGEESGALPEAFRSLSAYYENEFDESAKRLSALVEPLLMALMGGAVGFVAIAMISPIYEITQHLHAN
jgi:type II secretory pathway component PulF